MPRSSPNGRGVLTASSASPTRTPPQTSNKATSSGPTARPATSRAPQRPDARRGPCDSRPRMSYVFGDFELDDSLFELRSCGERVALRPQALEVFFHLVRNRERVVTREELHRTVWSGTAI